MEWNHYQVVDLTQPIDAASCPTWEGIGYEQFTVTDYSDNGFLAQGINSRFALGTHMDSPAHRIEGGSFISEIGLERLMVPARVFDFSSEKRPGFVITREMIEHHEKQWGNIPASCCVLFYTGQADLWRDPEAYRKDFPVLSIEAAELLVLRNVNGIGIDTLSPDGPDSDFPVHRLLLGKGIYIIENIASCKTLPPKGTELIILPTRFEKTSESFVRMIALLVKNLQ